MDDKEKLRTHQEDDLREGKNLVGGLAHFSFEMETPLGPIRGKVAVDPGPMRLAELVPTAQELTNILAERAKRREQVAGKQVSCREKCSVCCSHFVPLSPPEAFYIADLIDSLDEDRREAVCRRIDAAVDIIDQRGMVHHLLYPEYTEDPEQAIAVIDKTFFDYFSLKIPCPFLDEESCSIYPHRLLACREYNVTSPAAWCADPYRNKVETVKMPLPLSASLARLTAELTGIRPQLIPLTLALRWVKDHAAVRGRHWPGLELFQRFITVLGQPPWAGMGLQRDKQQSGGKHEANDRETAKWCSMDPQKKSESPVRETIAQDFEAEGTEKSKAHQEGYPQEAQNVVGGLAHFSFEMKTPLGPIRGKVAVDTGPTRLAELVPTALEITDIFVERAKQREQKAGREVSCREKCSVCCNQLVPLSPPEAFYLADLIDSFDEERRDAVRCRIEAVASVLEDRAMIDHLMDPEYTDEPVLAIAKDYFFLKIPCPFLIDASCTIYHHRPIACREYNVTSPAKWCNDPYALRVEKLPMPLPLSAPLARLTAELTGMRPRLIPLTLALRWVAEHAGVRYRQWPGTELFQRFMAVLGEMPGKGKDAKKVEQQRISDRKERER